MYQVVKRNDKVVDFDLSKISAAIRKAFDAQSKQYNDNVIDFLALKVTADFEGQGRKNRRRGHSRQRGVRPHSRRL